jgi:hypothetical protein
MSHLVLQGDGSSVSAGMAYDRGCKPVQCKGVDYGVNETSDWRVFSTGPHTQGRMDGSNVLGCAT